MFILEAQDQRRRSSHPKNLIDGVNTLISVCSIAHTAFWLPVLCAEGVKMNSHQSARHQQDAPSPGGKHCPLGQ